MRRLHLWVERRGCGDWGELRTLAGITALTSSANAFCRRSSSEDGVPLRRDGAQIFAPPHFEKKKQQDGTEARTCEEDHPLLSPG